MNVPGSLSSALQAMYFGFGDFLSTNCHFIPVGNPAPPRPRRPDALTMSTTCVGCQRERFPQALVPLVLQIEIEREGIRLANVFGEQGFHLDSTVTTKARSGTKTTIPMENERRELRVLRAFVVRRHCFSLDHVMAPAQRGFAARAQIVEQRRHVLRPQPLVPRVVDHHDRRSIACAEAFDFEQRERAARDRSRRARSRASRTISSVTRSAPFSAHDSVRHTCSTNLPTGLV